MSLEKPRLARLTAIINQLQSKRMITAREIAEKHGISIRTVYRDIRTIESSGIPIITEEGRGYSLLRGYKLPPIAFTEEEANALITAEQIINQNKDQSLIEQYNNALIKVKSVLKYSQQEKTELLEDRIQIRNNPDKKQSSDLLMKLQTALTNYEVVKIDYLSLENETSTRTIEPFAIFSTKDNWILVAFCQLKNAFRSFRLDCIQSFQHTGEHFEPHPITLQEYFEQCRQNWGSTPDIPLTQRGNTFA